MHFLWDAEIRGYGDTEIRRYAGGLLKESPEPPRTFLKLYLAEAGWWGERIPRRRGWRAWGNRFSLPPLSRRETCPVGRLPTLPLVCFLALPSPKGKDRPPPPPSPVGKGETKVIFMQGASPLASPGGWAGCGTGSGWDAASGGGLPRAARASQFGFSKPGRSG